MYHIYLQQLHHTKLERFNFIKKCLMSIVCIYIYFQSGELLIVPLGIKMDYDFNDSVSIQL